MFYLSETEEDINYKTRMHSPSHSNKVKQFNLKCHSPPIPPNFHADLRQELWKRQQKRQICDPFFQQQETVSIEKCQEHDPARKNLPSQNASHSGQVKNGAKNKKSFTDIFVAASGKASASAKGSRKVKCQDGKTSIGFKERLADSLYGKRGSSLEDVCGSVPDGAHEDQSKKESLKKLKARWHYNQALTESIDVITRSLELNQKPLRKVSKPDIFTGHLKVKYKVLAKSSENLFSREVTSADQQHYASSPPKSVYSKLPTKSTELKELSDSFTECPRSSETPKQYFSDDLFLSQKQNPSREKRRKSNSLSESEIGVFLRLSKKSGSVCTSYSLTSKKSIAEEDIESIR